MHVWLHEYIHIYIIIVLPQDVVTVANNVDMKVRYRSNTQHHILCQRHNATKQGQSH